MAVQFVPQHVVEDTGRPAYLRAGLNKEVVMVKDPVCGMMVDKKFPPQRTFYNGKEYCFCCTDCKGKFDENPAKYAVSSVEKQSS